MVLRDYFHGHLILWFLLLVILASLVPVSVSASEASCFSRVTYATPAELRAKRGLYILIDETAPLTKAMVAKVQSLVKGWGKPGDMIKIARFSASYRGLYPELLFSRKVEAMPDDAYMFNLHYRDKVSIKECLEEQKNRFKKDFPIKLTAALKHLNPKIPKTELLGSLKQLSKKLVVPNEALSKTVLLVSDGMENSSVISFYKNKNLRSFNVKATISKLRRKGMMGFWKNTKVYMYGTGLMPDKKRYADPKTVQNLKYFWERYFVAGGAKSAEIGTPELLLTALN
ncbi:MAG TPA: hypothetical protein ENK06_06960 [Gammaproteobacteria bacterium]|nr:hypothetical protein [Gammaproteobacteria bacterium]